MSEQQKVIVMIALVALLGAIWGWRLMKGRGPGDSSSAKVEEKPVLANAVTATQTTEELAVKPLPPVRSEDSGSTAELPKAVVLKALPMFSRDPFAVSDAMAKLLIKPEPVKEEGKGAEQGVADAAPEEETAPTLKLEGTAIVGSTRYALINGEVVVVGQTYHDMKVTEIHEREVVLEAPAGALRLAIE